MKQTDFFVLLLAVALGGGCGNDGPKYPGPPQGAKPEGYLTETRPFTIGSDTYEADYGTISVPENRSKAASRLIHLPFLRIHSHSQNPAEPIFAFAGGPGASNMSWGWEKAGTFLSEHDFVLVGYRGVDGSIVLDCPEVSQAFRECDSLSTEETMRKIGRAWSSAAERLQAGGIDLDGYTMLETIDDNESVRRALGYEHINLLSESYGTRVAYLYGLKYPERISRSAMIAVNPPGRFVWEPQMIDAQLKQYSALWSRDSIMSLKCPDLYATMCRVLTTMPRNWFFFSINPDKVRVATFGLLMHRGTAAKVFDAYVEAARGDFSGLALMSLAYDYLVPSMCTWGESASKAASADFDPARNYLHDMNPAGLPLASPMSMIVWTPLSYGNWPTRTLPQEFRVARHSDVQTLLLSGSVDFSTPPVYATNDLLPHLTNGQQIILSECGHVGDMWYANPDNTRLMLSTFFRTGVPDVSKNSYIPMDFSVSWGFPRIAKTVLAVAIFLVLGLAMLIFWLRRRRRRMKAHCTTGQMA